MDPPISRTMAVAPSALALKRKDFKLNSPFALACYLSMIFSENR
jgi:hypothetical protein